MCTRPIATSSRRRCPPDRVETGRIGLLGEVERRDELVGALVGLAAAHPERPGLADQLVAPALGVAGRVALADVADRAPHVAVLAYHVVPGDLGACRRSVAAGW